MLGAATILALAGWSAANLVLAGLAILLWRPLRLQCPRLDLLVLGFLWIYLTTLAVLVFGLFGWLDGPAMLATSALATPLLWRAWRRGELRLELGSLRARLGTAAWGTPQYLLAAGLALLAAAQAVRLLAHVWLLPPHVWDALSYHLPNVAEWVQRGRVTTFETPVDRTLWPANNALLQTWFVLFWRHDLAIEAAGLPAYALATGSVYSIARSLHVRRAMAAFAALAFGYAPSTALPALSCQNDLAIAAAFLLAVALLADHRDRGTAPRQRAVLLAMVLCLAFGTKPYIAFTLPGLLVLALWSWRRRPAPVAPLPPRRRLPRPVLAVAAASGALLGGFWYARNLWLFGNPFHPVDFRLFGTLLFGTGQSEAQQGTFSLGSLGESLGTLLGQRIFDSWGPFSADLTYMTGWGWFSFACGLPALALGVVRAPDVRWLALGFAASLLSLFCWVTPDPWNLRFALWFPAVLALAFAVVVPRLALAPVRRALCGLAAACLVLNFVGTLNPTPYLTLDHWRRILSMPVAERSTAVLGLFIGGGYYDALTTVPAGEPLGYCVGGNGWVYPLFGPDLSREVRYVPIAADADVAALLAERGVRYLLVCNPPLWSARRVAAAVKAGELERIGDGLFVTKN